MKKLLVATSLLGCLAFAASASAEQSTVTERETKTSFQVQRNFGGVPHILTGVGAREATALKINVYGGAMYVGRDQAVKAWQSYVEGRFAKAGLVSDGTPDFAKIGRSAAGRHFIVYGRMPRAIDMHFVRDVRADQITDTYNENWERVRLDRNAAGEALNQFMAAVNHPVASGQHMIIRTVGNTVFVDMPGQAPARIRGNRALTTAIWKIYFGNPPLQTELRNGMLSMLQNVHQLFTAASGG